MSETGEEEANEDGGQVGSRNRDGAKRTSRPEGNVETRMPITAEESGKRSED